MNKILIISIFSIFSYTIKAQVLNVNLVIQEQNQWCWAAVSKCVLDYYGDSISQCKIAEYTRNVATWHNFGSQDCCQTPNGDCNYWNYNWGYAGSIQDILSNFGKIQNYGKADSLTFDKFSTEIKNKRPLIIRWAWTSGGGHFVVGYGISDNSVYYMNPWPGEGFKISLYDWVVSNSEHNWKGTNIMITDPVLTSISSVSKNEEIKIYPNPTSGIITLELILKLMI